MKTYFLSARQSKGEGNESKIRVGDYVERIEGKKLNGLDNGYKSHSVEEKERVVYLRCQDAEKTPIKIDECENPVEISVLIEYMMSRDKMSERLRFKLITWKRLFVYTK
jgi:hypothetical protein